MKHSRITVYDDYNSVIPQNQNIIGTITTMFGRDSLRHGFKILEINNSSAYTEDLFQNRTMKRERDFHKQVRVVYRACRRLYGIERTQDECLRVFKVVFPELYRLRNSNNERAQIPQTVSDAFLLIVHDWNPHFRLMELVSDVLEQMQMPFDWKREELMQFYEDIMPVVMRIRKLTPRECFRLMDVDEKDIDTLLNSGLSNSSLYRLAGNSICISQMLHLFRKLFIETGPDIEKGKPLQLTLF